MPKITPPNPEPRRRGSTNVFADLGYPDAEIRKLKTQLAGQLNDIIDAAGWTQHEAAEHLGLHEPNVSELQRYKLSSYSLDRLISLLIRLGCIVAIEATEPRTRRKPSPETKTVEQ